MRRFCLLICALLLLSCEGTTYRSSVPSYPVGLDLNLQLGTLTLFRTPGDHLEFTRNHYPQGLTPVLSDALGFAGILVYIAQDGRYVAWDLCCPHCLLYDQPVELEPGLTFFASCPICGEVYDLSFGFGQPTKGIGREALRRYTCTSGNNHLRITP